MSSSGIRLTITPYTPSTLPSEHVLVDAGKALFTTLGSWREGKTFGNTKGKTPYSVRTLSRSKGPGDGAAWHARVSEHTEGSFDDFWDGLGRDKALKEQEFIPELAKATLLKSLSPTQTLWSLQYKFPPPVSPRVFTVLQVTHLAGGDDGTPREGWVISVPVDVTEDAGLKSKEEKGVKGRYVSIERIAESKDGKVEWTMATSSTPGGNIPQFIAERTMPSTISKDVLHFVQWVSKNKAPAPTSSLPNNQVVQHDPQPPPAPRLDSDTQQVTTKKLETEFTEHHVHPESTPAAPEPAVVAVSDASSPGE